jgi:hypothetical protein
LNKKFRYNYVLPNAEKKTKFYLMHPKLFIIFKCEFQSENNKRSLDAFPSSQHFRGKRGILELWDGV